MKAHTPLYQELSSLLLAIENCEKAGNHEWHSKHRDNIKSLVSDLMPSGSGIDSGTSFDFDASKPERLVLSFGYHHMDEGGGYDGWTYHTAVVKPSLAFDFDLRITGPDRNGIKDYLHECYEVALREETATTTAE